jgi:hypothetical protein
MGLNTSSRYSAKFISGRQISRVSPVTINTFLTISTKSGRKPLSEKDSHQAATNRKTSLGEKKMGRLVIVESGMILRKERNLYAKKKH